MCIGWAMCRLMMMDYGRSLSSSVAARMTFLKVASLIKRGNLSDNGHSCRTAIPRRDYRLTLQRDPAYGTSGIYLAATANCTAESYGRSSVRFANSTTAMQS